MTTILFYVFLVTGIISGIYLGSSHCEGKKGRETLALFLVAFCAFGILGLTLYIGW